MTALALTDHDTLAGQAEAAAAAAQAGITHIPGIEFSTQWLGRSVHIVGLGFDPAADSLTQGIERQAASRTQRALTIGERLAKAGIHNAYEGALELAGRVY